MASLFGDYQPGAISSFLSSHKAGAEGKKEKKAKPEKAKAPAPALAPAPAPAPALLFDEATRARFQPQQPLPGLVAPLPKRGREGEDGEQAKKKTKKGKERPPRPLKSEKEAARQQKQGGGVSADRAPLVLAQPPETPSASAVQDQQPPKPKQPNQQAKAKQEDEAVAPAAEKQKKAKKPKKEKQQEAAEAPEPAAEAPEEDEAAAASSGDEEGGEQRTQEDAEDKERRTVFVGNLPNTFTKPRLCALFKEFGPIESVRFRSMALAGAKVGDHGNQRLAKKVSANKRLLSEAKDAFNAYVVFAQEESAAKALAANNRVVEGHHLRVDRVGAAATRDPQRTVFLGNVAFDATEEEVRAHFAAALQAEGGDAAIEAVRLVRDAETQVGKGFGFVLLQDKATAAVALRLLHEAKFKGRPLRVTACGKRARKNPERGSPRVLRVRPNKKDKKGGGGGGGAGAGAGFASPGGKGKGKEKKPRHDRGEKKRPSFEGRRASAAGPGAGAAGAGIRLKKRKAAPGAKKKGGGAGAKAKKGRK